MPRALISVSDKRGVAKFARDLVDMGWEIISTGGTAHVISQAGVDVTAIEGGRRAQRGRTVEGKERADRQQSPRDEVPDAARDLDETAPMIIEPPGQSGAIAPRQAMERGNGRRER